MYSHTYTSRTSLALTTGVLGLLTVISGISLTISNIRDLKNLINKDIVIEIKLTNNLMRYSCITSKQLRVSSLKWKQIALFFIEMKHYNINISNSTIVDIHRNLYNEIFLEVFKCNLRNFGKLGSFLFSEDNEVIKLSGNLALKKSVVFFLKSSHLKRRHVFETIFLSVDTQQSFDYNLCYEIESFIDPSDVLDELQSYVI